MAEASRQDSLKDYKRVSLVPALDYTLHHSLLQGVVTSPEVHSAEGQPEVMSRVGRRVQTYASAFSEKAQTLVHGLQTHTDPDCRFLAIRLSFSDFYKSKSRA